MVKANAMKIATSFAARMKRDQPVGGALLQDAQVEFGREV
jgi:hypothetical protein